MNQVVNDSDHDTSPPQPADLKDCYDMFRDIKKRLGIRADERQLWQGLAQLAVGITHVQRGNPDGAATLLGRGSGRLRELDHPAPYSVDADGLIRWAAALLDDLAARAEISSSSLRPTLVKP